MRYSLLAFCYSWYPLNVAELEQSAILWGVGKWFLLQDRNYQSNVVRMVFLTTTPHHYAVQVMQESRNFWWQESWNGNLFLTLQKPKNDSLGFGNLKQAISFLLNLVYWSTLFLFFVLFLLWTHSSKSYPKEKWFERGGKGGAVLPGEGERVDAIGTISINSEVSQSLITSRQ